jgi:MtN3 and saliva related transmembrane protein
MTAADLVGTVAAFVGTSLMLPQVIKTWRTKRVDDLSLAMLVLYFLNCVLWLTYGILIDALPVTLCKGTALVIGAFQLGMMFAFRGR